jgi:hypothetical protein
MSFAGADIENRFADVIRNPFASEHSQNSCLGTVTETDKVKIPLRRVIQVSPNILMERGGLLAGGLGEEGGAEQLVVHSAELD